MKWYGDAAIAKVRKAQSKALRQAAEMVLTKSKKVVPVLQEELSRSGSVSYDDRRMLAVISYNTPYALVQHEDLSFRHKAGRTAKYLERPFNENKAAAQTYAANAIKSALKG